MKLFFSLYKTYVRGSYLRHQQSWGEGKAIYFTEFSISILLGVVLTPLVVLISIIILKTVEYIPYILLFVGMTLLYFIKKLSPSNDEMYPSVDSLKEQEVKDEKLNSDLIFYSTL